MTTEHDRSILWRVFIAIPLPDKVKHLIAAEMQMYERKFGKRFKRMTYKQDYHITLQFIGDVLPIDVAAIAAKMEVVAESQQPFKLSLEQWHTFGRPNSPRVLWMGVQDQSEALQLLQARIVDNMGHLGYIMESRPYQPHITTARQYIMKHGIDYEYAEGKLGQLEAQWSVDRMVLYRTHLGEHPMYRIIAEHSFSRGNNQGSE